MSMYDMFKTEESVEKSGVVIDYGSFRVRVARAGGANRNYSQLLDRLLKPHRRALQLDALDNKVAERIMKEAAAKALVLDWEVEVDGAWVRGMHAPDGSVREFSFDNVMRAFDDLPDLFADIQQQAQKIALFRADVREIEAKN